MGTLSCQRRMYDVKIRLWFLSDSSDLTEESRMARRFNITGFCNPQKHYMVRLDDRLKIIKETYVDNE